MRDEDVLTGSLMEDSWLTLEQAAAACGVEPGWLQVHLEEGLWSRAEELERLGQTVVCDPETDNFGGGQAILVEGDALVGGSDPRKDGYAAGY